jgi:MYXO-CTERM domain-containing protein
VAGIYKSTGVTGSINETITISFDLLGRSDSAVYTGTFTASLWDGVPGVGTQLVSNVPVNPAAGITSAISFSTTLVSNTAANLHVAFNAGVSGNGAFQQAIIDNVLVTAVPEPSVALLGGLGMLALLRRRR